MLEKKGGRRIVNLQKWQRKEKKKRKRAKGLELIFTQKRRLRYIGK